MKAISLHQPWLSLLVTHESCNRSAWLHPPVHAPTDHPMVKRFETRSWPCPPSIIGQHVAFASTKRKPNATAGETLTVGEWTMAEGDTGEWALFRGEDEHSTFPLPLGCVVGSGIITASYRIWNPEHLGQSEPPTPWIANIDGRLLVYQRRVQDTGDISDQLPYGNWTPGRYAWEITDAAPTTERCPWCWHDRPFPFSGMDDADVAARNCTVCNGAGRCDPIPVTGRQGFWNWEPT